MATRAEAQHALPAAAPQLPAARCAWWSSAPHPQVAPSPGNRHPASSALPVLLCFKQMMDAPLTSRGSGRRCRPWRRQGQTGHGRRRGRRSRGPRRGRRSHGRGPRRAHGPHRARGPRRARGRRGHLRCKKGKTKTIQNAFPDSVMAAAPAHSQHHQRFTAKNDGVGRTTTTVAALRASILQPHHGSQQEPHVNVMVGVRTAPAAAGGSLLLADDAEAEEALVDVLGRLSSLLLLLLHKGFGGPTETKQEPSDKSERQQATTSRVERLHKIASSRRPTGRESLHAADDRDLQPRWLLSLNCTARLSFAVSHPSRWLQASPRRRKQTRNGSLFAYQHTVALWSVKFGPNSPRRKPVGTAEVAGGWTAARC